MVYVVLTMLVCLLLSAAIALYVAYGARGRPLPPSLTSLRAVPRRVVRGTRRVRPGLRSSGDGTAEGARS